MEEEIPSVPTASDVMMQPSSPRKEIPNGEDRHSRPKLKGRRMINRGGNNNTKKTEDDQDSLFVRAPKDKLHDKKSRSGKRGIPKKEGGGGKGTWGRIGDELQAEVTPRDHKDPNYDSEDEESNELTYLELQPELSEEEFRQQLEPIIQEYFEHGETEEVILSLSELNFDSIRSDIVVCVITLALEKKATQRELASILISDLYGKFVTQKEIAEGFQTLLSNLDDLGIDTPDAPKVLGKFIARAIADDCIPPVFVQVESNGELQEKTLQNRALEEANSLMHMTQSMVRLDNVWGVGGGRRPVKKLIKKIVQLLKEYLDCEDAEEASRCLQELEVPHFHHELVYEALIMVLEDGTPRVNDLMVKLLGSMDKSNVVCRETIWKGVERVFRNMPDISLDSPHSYTYLETVCLDLLKNGLIETSQLNKMPTRGRKRFVSEGDGGLVKSL